MTTPDSQSNSVEQAIEDAWDSANSFEGKGHLLDCDRDEFVEQLLKDPRIRQSIIESLTKEELDQVLDKYLEQVAWMNVRDFPHTNKVHELLVNTLADDLDEKELCKPLYVLKTQPEQSNV